MTRLTNARLPDGRHVDLTLQNGRIATITPHSNAPSRTTPDDTDLGAALLLPGLVDGHVHLDKTLMGQPWRPNAPAPSVPGRVSYERAHRRELGPVRPRAMALLARMIAAGTTALRTHTDIDDNSGLANFHGTLEVAQQMRAILPIQIVAFPQSGILTHASIPDLLDAALAKGGVAILTSAPGPGPMPPVKHLRAHGVTIAGGNDNIRDLWSPFGTGDMLERAWMIAQRQGFRADEDLALAYETCSTAGARMMNLPIPALAPGAPATFLALQAETLAEAITERPRDRQVWIAGIKQ